MYLEFPVHILYNQFHKHRQLKILKPGVRFY